MVEVLLKLEKEINEGGLIIREDRKLDADLGWYCTFQIVMCGNLLLYETTFRI
jgi:hypothetical protein